MDAVEDIKSRLSIEDVISRYVELKRAGRNFRGLSPFNSEKTPSFMVSPEKQIWHDFSSGKGGNMFSFVMEMEGVDFKGALELLARQASIDLGQYLNSRDGQLGKQKERLYKALELAAKFYQIHFSKNRQALEYILKTRRFSKETALTFQIGYSPNSGDSLTKFLLKKGFTVQELKLAGLTTQRYKEPNDMFRGRIMIPLMDPFGKIIGFTARLLNDEPNAPKYINTPQTMLYDKSHHIYGLHLAKEAIRQNGYMVVVEGNLDVIASHQAGFRQVVATAGTAMTEAHLKIVGHLTRDVRIAFDQDKAGLLAVERTIPLASKADVSLSIITIKGGKDPDELINNSRTGGPKVWQKAMETPDYAVDWLLTRYQGQFDINSAKGKREFTDILLKVIRVLADSVEQDHYIVQLSKLISIDPEALRSKMKSIKNGAKPILRKTNRPPQTDKEVAEYLKSQNHFLAIMLMQPSLRMYLKTVDSAILPETVAQKLLAYLHKNPKFVFDGSAKPPDGTGEYCDILVLLYEELYQDLGLLELRYEAAQLQARLVQQYVKNEKIKLASTMRKSGETTSLLKRAKKFDELLKSIKERINV